MSVSSNDHISKPSTSQAATNASEKATKRVRVPAGAGKWQQFVKGNDGGPIKPTSGTKFTGFDGNGKAHQMVRAASEGDSSDDSDDTIADPRERARLAKEEVRVPASFLIMATDGYT